MPPKQRIAKIKEFPPNESSKIHAINVTMQFAVEDERQQGRKNQEILEQEDRAEKLATEILELQKRSEAAIAELNALRKNPELNEEAQEILEVFENIESTVEIEEGTKSTAGKRKKAWNKRPEC